MKIFIGENHSCDVNYDYKLAHIELSKFWKITRNPEEADIIVLTSTCCGSLGNMDLTINYILDILNRKKDEAKTFVSGCITREFLNDELNNIINEFLKENFDYIIPEGRIDMIVNILANKELLNNKFGVGILLDNKIDLYISSGCMNKCSFCKTTSQDLQLKSMSLDDIVNIIKNLPSEINSIEIIGTNITQYGLDLYKSYKLVDIINLLEGIDNIRDVTLLGFGFKDAIHNNFSDSLKYSSKVKRIIGSLESGSNRILSLMKKGFTREEFLEFNNEIQKIHHKDLILDIIAGFPTETIDDIKMTLDLLQKVNPLVVRVNKYQDSPYIYSHIYEQLSNKEIEDHYQIYQKVLKK